MPKAILALRSYPLAILMAMALFLCSLILATSSTGIGGGGENGGSGMGGTGKSGLPGESGFGGTGGPSPFLGDISTGNDEQNRAENPEPGSDKGPQIPADWPAPWLERETETAAIPDAIAPLIELQRNPLRDPTVQPPAVFPENPEALRIIEQDNSNLPTLLRQQLELANSGEVMTESAPIEIRLQIPEISAPEPLDMPVLQRLSDRQQAGNATPAVDETISPPTNDNMPMSSETQLVGETDAAPQNPGTSNLAEHDNEQIPEILTERPEVLDPRSTTERIKRPELPPFQRMRPAVDRASLIPARPQPMRI